MNSHPIKSQGRLEGKVAVITGGSRGIGAAIARRLAADGARVVLTYHSDETRAKAVVQAIADAGGSAKAMRVNASSQLDNKILFTGVGKFNVLVNNAAIFHRVPVEKIDLEQYQKVFDTNVRGVVATTLTALPHIADGGRIINITNFGASYRAVPGVGLYMASKAAVEALTRTWAQDLGGRRITVNAVAPGAVLSDMLDQGLDSEEARQGFIARTALKRLGEPDDIADVVAFFASDDSRWVTGKIIEAEGGLAF
jgi:3-oxoacyl-[acyl-carrier protein] reductase